MPSLQVGNLNFVQAALLFGKDACFPINTMYDF